MINTILIGIFVGLCASAPTGPLGVLCIQRTISHGKAHGFATALGAMTSDVAYAILVVMGMTYIVTFIEDNITAIQIGGCIIIGIYGVHMFCKNPKIKTPAVEGHIESHKLSKSELVNDYLSALLLCLSNPLIVFLFIALFAQFTVIESDNMLSNIVLIISILIGAMIWWLSLIFVVGRFRHLLGLRRQRLINKIAGSILIIIAIGTIVYSLNNVIIV